MCIYKGFEGFSYKLLLGGLGANTLPLLGMDNPIFYLVSDFRDLNPVWFFLFMQERGRERILNDIWYIN